MTPLEILTKARAAHKGSWISLTKTKDLGHGVTKISTIVVRLGVSYEHMKVNAERLAATGGVAGGLPWGHWVDGYEGLVIEHKGNFYLRVANSYVKHHKTRYEDATGQELSIEEATAIVGASKMKTSEAAVYNINFQNILALGK